MAAGGGREVLTKVLSSCRWFDGGDDGGSGHRGQGSRCPGGGEAAHSSGTFSEYRFNQVRLPFSATG